MPTPPLPRVVIIGAGFGGLACARKLGGKPVDVLLIDKRNHHLFQPLLYQVATAALSPADIAEPIRRLVSAHRNIRVLLGEVVGVSAEDRHVVLADGTTYPYDILVLATGSEYGYFGHEEWARHAPGLKTLENARTLRATILKAFERAEISADPVEQADLTTSVVIGGGPTGVEMAGAIAELGRWTLARDFRRIDPTKARVLLIEGGPRLLPSFPERLSAYARRELEKLGVTVILDTPVEDIRADGVIVGGALVKAGTIVWGAGVRPSPAARWLGLPPDKAGFVEVAENLSVRGMDAVYAIGDTASFMDPDGRRLPGLAQVAKQQGEHLGAALSALVSHGTPVPPFTYHSRGNTAVIGRHAAVFDFGRRQMMGRTAWILWAVVHVYLLVSFEKRVLVSLQWLWRYFTRARGARLIP
jgi:NADH dehydrogenase